MVDVAVDDQNVPSSPQCWRIGVSARKHYLAAIVVTLLCVLAALAIISSPSAAAAGVTDTNGRGRLSGSSGAAILHPRCLQPYVVLGSDRDALGQERVRLIDHLPKSGPCRWDRKYTSPKNQTVQRVRRCGAASQWELYESGEPSLAIDGVYSQAMFERPACAHTLAEPGAWWQVDLQASAEVETVQVWGRTDCCADRLGWATVVVSTTEDYTDGGRVCRGASGNFFQRDRTEVFDCSRTIGRYITVTLANPRGGTPLVGMITICELDAWGRFMKPGATDHGASVQQSTHQGERGHENRSICDTLEEPDPDWRQLRRVQNTLTNHVVLHPRHGRGEGLPRAHSCGQSDVNITGGVWYRFAGVYDTLPTEPVRLSSSVDVSYSCGTLSSAWVSGWDPSNSDVVPPLNYRQPGAYPGQGPQFINSDVQQRVLCFEGWWPPNSEAVGDALWQYRSCGDSARATVLHCGSFLLWQLPAPPAVVAAVTGGTRPGTPPSQAYCTWPSGEYGNGLPLPLPQWQREGG